ncbi:hypothetical protein P154DRAFT_522115 [Amniculicola lignicola CBS 123094]|uniref:DUF7730 domain-containing protein n=1 Tax=Amniculicola lignicola CBS 123094 TaxID=1392246 RepID=A0A6A5WJ36_9PLEO|nr:hypothetical protein P154DRAFT_522115 [Amniculicola lignicola CBS 123094]
MRQSKGEKVKKWAKKPLASLGRFVCAPCIRCARRLCLSMIGSCQKLRRKPPGKPPPKPIPMNRKRDLTLPIERSMWQKTKIQRCALFTELPSEIRQQIYLHVLGGLTIHFIMAAGRLRSEICFEGECCSPVTKVELSYQPDRPRSLLKGSIGLLRSCRQIYSEAYPVLYTHNSFIINHLPGMKNVPEQLCASISEPLYLLPNSMLSSRIRLIRSLDITWWLLPPFREFSAPWPLPSSQWEACWKTLAAMTSLRSLRIKFQMIKFINLP